MDSTGGYDGDEGGLLKEAAMHFTRIVRDRLYITNDLPLQQLESEWYDAVELWSKNKRDYDILEHAYKLISQLIIQAANQSVPKTAIQRLAFWK
jgi:hypothetical protein